jgi:hypothetical protein
MIDVDRLLESLPQDNDECISLIIRRYLSQNKNELHHSIRSDDDVEILTAALAELDAFRRIPTLEMALAAKSDALIAQNLTTLVGILDREIIQSRKQAVTNQTKERVIERIRAHKNTFFGFARLTADERIEIHEHLDAIRGIIESSKIDNRKRNALLARLNSLSSEVDKIGTKMDGFVAVWVDLWFAFGTGVSAAKPAFDELKEILKILYQSRAKEEQIPLPSPHEHLQLPAPDNE